MIIACSSLSAQAVNWGSLENKDKHLVYAWAGVLHGVHSGLGYGYKINNRLFPIVLTADYSFPSGKKLLDDFKTRAGGSVNWVNYHGFRFSTSIHGVFRRYQNDFVRLSNFGAEASGTAGYYKRRWFAAAEFGFDKAIVTHFKHSKIYREQFPGAENGWYEPATGGNFFYGLQLGFSFGKSDVYVKAGKTYAEDFKTKPLVPMYGQLGYNLKF